MSDYMDEQPDLFDSVCCELERTDLEKENEELKNLLMGYTCADDTSTASRKFLMLVIKRMERYLTTSRKQKIVLSSLYTLHNDVDDTTFENVLNDYIHEFGLKCHDWDEYYAERKGTRRRR